MLQIWIMIKLKKNHFAHIYLFKVHVGYMHEIDAAFFGVVDKAFSDSKATVE